MNATDVAIIGAGPYGLSLAAHLAAKHVEHRIFGHPMAFWSKIAAAGPERYLKSFCFGTNISIPAPGFSFPEYNRARGLETFEPCAMTNFAEYGIWVQRHCVPWVEDVNVENVTHDGTGFILTLSSAANVKARRVVVATGLSHLEYVPPSLSAIAPEFVTHTAHVENYSSFADRDVAVVGSGQSALEAAALLMEAGARPILLARGPSIRWMSRLPKKRTAWQRIRHPVSQLAVGPKAWMLAKFPGGAHYLPDRRRLRLLHTYLPPEGAWWLRERVDNRLPIRLTTTIARAEARRGHVILTLEKDGREETCMVDHAIAGTGYRMETQRLSFLSPALRGSIQRIAEAPRLNRRFECSAPGLYFAGPIASACFGPLFRFVAGAEHAAKTIANDVARRYSRRTFSLAPSTQHPAHSSQAPETL